MLHRFQDGSGGQSLYSPIGLAQLAQATYGSSVTAAYANLAAFENLCGAFEAARPRQTAFGKIHAQAILLDALGKGVRLAGYLRQYPNISTTNLPSAVFIVAPFRTGTTFLHRLLACDPQNRAPRIWEAAYPPPAEQHLRGNIRYFVEDTRIAKAAAALRTLYRASPALARLHPMAPGAAEECFGLLETSFLSHSFMFHAELPSYLDWLNSRGAGDWAAAYRTYAAQLRLLHWWYPGQRWVLKCPAHLWNIDALLKAFPQAYVIHLHRDPVDAIGSFCRLFAAYRHVMSTSTAPASIGEQVFCYTREVLHRAVTARREADASRFVDIGFSDLIRDPIGQVQAIYARIGAPLSSDAQGAMRQWIARTKSEQEGVQAPLESFGLDGRDARDVFAAYDSF